MKNIHQILVAAVLLAACQGAEKPAATPVADENAPTPPAWSGSFTDTLPCADCPGILTRLQLRPDSIYVFTQEYLERDSIPYGTIGRWTANGDRLTLRTFQTPMHWLWKDGRPVMVGEDWAVAPSGLDYGISPVQADVTGPMHLTGGYVYYADSHSFTPCGADFILPVAMDPPGTESAGLALERTYMAQVKEPKKPLYVQVTGTLHSGPAMEGDGTDTYLHVDSVEGVLEIQQCR